MGKKITQILLFLLGLQLLLNFAQVFTPEIGFDALWYHLTLPKLWLLKHQYYFSGGLLYYSAMPRLTETIFTPLLYYFGATGPKFLQFISGVGILLVMRKILSTRSIGRAYQIIAFSLFYSTWLVSWESSSAYIDLFRSFLEILALYFFLEDKKLFGSLFLGLALGTKWISIISLAIYSFVFGIGIILPVIFFALPWFLIAYYYTGNPVYPLFSSILQNGFQKPINALINISLAPIRYTFPFDDFISPLVGLIFIFLVFSLFVLKKNDLKIALIGFFGFISTLFLDPSSSRFLLPYLPVAIIAFIIFFHNYFLKYTKVLMLLSLVSAITITSLRIYSIQKYLPYLLKKQTQNELLTALSSRLPDTFIDSDNFVAKNLPGNALYLIDNLHNLYYFPYNFDHTSWADKTKNYDYLVTKNQDPAKIEGSLLHTNSVGIQVYKLK